jgi:hypothetical protein
MHEAPGAEFRVISRKLAHIGVSVAKTVFKESSIAVPVLPSSAARPLHATAPLVTTGSGERLQTRWCD